MNNIIISTSNSIAGHEITEHLGLVRGNTIRARHLGKDILAVFRNILGGEINEYTKLMAESREQALDRMLDEASSLGADAIIDVRFCTSMVAQGAAELLAYVTAIKIKQLDN